MIDAMERFAELAKKVNNWGRWGPDDQRGTLNFLTPEAIARGASCVKTGKTFCLGLPLSEKGPQMGVIRHRINPIRTMTAINEPITGDPDGPRMSDDLVVMSLQGATHWDSLAHISYLGRLYNGVDAAAVGAAGASRLGIDSVGALCGRGVLLDVARAAGVDSLAGGHALTGEDLDAAAALGSVKILPGDIVLVRTGHVRHFLAGDTPGYTFTSPGLSTRTVEWFHAHDVAAVATDTLAFEVFPCESDEVFLPVHMLHLVEMGLTQGQNFNLEALGEDCAEDGVYEFFLDATPQPFVGGLGSPVNPLAVK